MSEDVFTYANLSPENQKTTQERLDWIEGVLTTFVDKVLARIESNHLPEDIIVNTAGDLAVASVKALDPGEELFIPLSAIASAAIYQVANTKTLLADFTENLTELHAVLDAVEAWRLMVAGSTLGPHEVALAKAYDALTDKEQEKGTHESP